MRNKMQALLIAAVLALALTAAAAPVVQHAKGTLVPKLEPLPLSNAKDDPARGRMSIAKQYHGDLEATALGEMLTGTGNAKGSAVYVAIERVTGTLNGRKGSFLMYHYGTMSRGSQHLEVSIVPDSGDGELAGISGTLSLVIEKDGTHDYTLDYTLPDKP